jgi:hypothetical protein
MFDGPIGSSNPRSGFYSFVASDIVLRDLRCLITLRLVASFNIISLDLRERMFIQGGLAGVFIREAANNFIVLGVFMIILYC